MERNKEFPKGWNRTILDEIIIKISNGITEKQIQEKTEYPISRIETISNEFIDFSKVKYLKNPSKDIIDKYRINEGDILFSNINSDSHLGKTAIFYEKKTLIHGMNLLLIRPDQRIIIPKFLNYYFKHYRNLGKFISVAQHAVNQSSINQTKLKSMEFILPSLNEQKRIVAKIEELLSLIEKIEETVKNCYDKISKISQKIIDDYTSLNNSNSMLEYQLGNISEIKGGVTLGRKLKGKTIRLPYLRVANVQDGYLDLEHIKNIDILESERDKWVLKTGDLLLTEGGDRDKLGRGTIWKEQIPNCIHQNHIFRVRFDQSRFIPEYISMILRSSISKHYFQSKGKQSVNLASINKTQLSAYKFLCPDHNSQKQKLHIIRQSLDELGDIEKICKTLLQILNNLKKSILKQAFEGKLVPQDPSDKPAEILLEKIKQEKKKIVNCFSNPARKYE